MDFQNTTKLDDTRLEALFRRHTAPYRHDHLTVRVRDSRGADFSGSCYYDDARILINLGQHVRYPYRLATHLAKARSYRTHWSRDTLCITVNSAYQLALFVYLHELYHYLVKSAGRGPRRKEGMCDRFAGRVLADEYGCAITDRHGRPAPRAQWDFKDLHAFVARAPRAPAPPAGHREIPVRILGLTPPPTPR